MIVFHHNDDDGRCAAAIISALHNSFVDPITFIECDYVKPITVPEPETRRNPYEEIFFVDLSLGDNVYTALETIIGNRDPEKQYPKITFIDHHKSSVVDINDANSRLWFGKNIGQYLTMFVKIGISGSLLSYIYTCMNNQEKQDPMSVDFDFSEKRTHFKFLNNNTTDNQSLRGFEREYMIPLALRYIDDNDLFLNENEVAKYFHLGFKMEKNKHPGEKMWQELLYNDMRLSSEFVKHGQLIYQYQEQINNDLIERNAFEYTIDGIKFLCINSCGGNSRLFGNRFDDYAGCIKFGYDGVNNKWVYSAYGSKVFDPDGKIDLSILAKKFGGGGHAKACGWSLDYLMFDVMTADRNPESSE